MQISNSLYTEFRKKYFNGEYNGQRYGQAFYNHFNLHKVEQSIALNQIYNGDYDTAVAAILTMIDWSN